MKDWADAFATITAFQAIDLFKGFFMQLMEQLIEGKPFFVFPELADQCAVFFFRISRTLREVVQVYLIHWA